MDKHAGYQLKKGDANTLVLFCADTFYIPFVVIGPEEQEPPASSMADPEEPEPQSTNEDRQQQVVSVSMEPAT